MVLKFKPKSNLKIIPKGSKTTKIIKGSKNRRGLTQVKDMLLQQKQTINFDIL